MQDKILAEKSALVEILPMKDVKDLAPYRIVVAGMLFINGQRI